MQKALELMGKALLVFGFTVACLSAGSSYSERISEIAKGQPSVRRAVTPVFYAESASRE